MRFTYRLKLGNVTAMFLLSHTQSLKGITSSVGKDQHIILFDLESEDGKPYSQVREELERTQFEYGLSNIYVVTDKPVDSWRAYCFNIVDLRTYLRILLSVPSVDMQFIRYTLRRDEATLRISQKKDRSKQKLFDVIESYYQEIPESFPQKLILYDTGIQKKGTYISLEKNKSAVSF